MSVSPARQVKCQICPWTGKRYYGAKGVLCDPCPRCGSRVAYRKPFTCDQAVTPDPKVQSIAA